MAFVLVGAVAVAVLAACVAFVLNRSFGIRARWLIPASAGAAMLGFTIYNDYTWAGRVMAGLPPAFRVTATGERSTALQPWSLAVPLTVRFVAVDLGALQVSEADPALRRAPVHFVARFQPTLTALQVFDCAGGRRRDHAGDAEAWTPLDPADPMLRAVCDAPAPG